MQLLFYYSKKIEQKAMEGWEGVRNVTFLEHHILLYVIIQLQQYVSSNFRTKHAGPLRAEVYSLWQIRIIYKDVNSEWEQSKQKISYEENKPKINNWATRLIKWM